MWRRRKRGGLGRVTPEATHLPVAEEDWSVPVFAAQPQPWLLGHGRSSPVLAGKGES